MSQASASSSDFESGEVHSPKELANSPLIPVSDRTIRNWCNIGYRGRKLNCIRAGRKIRIRRSDLLQFLLEVQS